MIVVRTHRSGLRDLTFCLTVAVSGGLRRLALDVPDYGIELDAIGDVDEDGFVKVTCVILPKGDAAAITYEQYQKIAKVMQEGFEYAHRNAKRRSLRDGHETILRLALAEAYDDGPYNVLSVRKEVKE